MNDIQVNAPPPGSWEHAVDERDLTVEQWKELIYKVAAIAMFEIICSIHQEGMGPLLFRLPPIAQLLLIIILHEFWK